MWHCAHTRIVIIAQSPPGKALRIASIQEPNARVKKEEKKLFSSSSPSADDGRVTRSYGPFILISASGTDGVYFVKDFSFVFFFIQIGKRSEVDERKKRKAIAGIYNGSGTVLCVCGNNNHTNHTRTFTITFIVLITNPRRGSMGLRGGKIFLWKFSLKLDLFSYFFFPGTPVERVFLMVYRHLYRWLSCKTKYIRRTVYYT